MATTFTDIHVDRVEPISASAGDTVRVFIPITYIGGGEYFTIYASIGKERLFGVFDEILAAERRYYFGTSFYWTTVTFTVDIPITTAISAGVYDVYAKVKEPNFVSPTLHQCITVVVAPVAVWIPLAIRNLVVAKAIIGAWIPLATRSLAVAKAIVGAWIPLAELTLAVQRSVVFNWIPLAEKSISLKVTGVVPPEPPVPPVPPEEVEFPWLPVALIAGGGIVAVAALTKPEKKETATKK